MKTIMKTIITALLTFFTFVGFAQTEENPIDITQFVNDNILADFTIGVGECNDSPTYYVYFGDLDLVDSNMIIRNSVLSVTGTLTISGIGSYTLECNSQLRTQTGNTLGVKQFNYVEEFPLNLKYIIYNQLGQVIQKGISNNNTHNEIPKNQTVIIKLEGYKPIQVLKL